MPGIAPGLALNFGAFEGVIYGTLERARFKRFERLERLERIERY
jgi:hypothetical protein